MGWLSDLLNEEFVIGPDNVQRFREDPSCLPEILEQQRSRGIGSPRGLREHRRAQQPQEPPRPGLIERSLPVVAAIGLGLLAAKLASDRKEDD